MPNICLKILYNWINRTYNILSITSITCLQFQLPVLFEDSYKICAVSTIINK